MSDTIFSESNIGKRLNKIQKKEKLRLFYQGKAYPVTGRIIIGRAKNCSILIDDSLVSREHALVQKIKEVYFITDLESRNGTFLNGKRLEPGKYMKLHSDDTVKIGRTEIIIL